MSDDTTDTTPEFDYQTVPDAPANEVPSNDQSVAFSNDAHERAAFSAYVKDQGGKIPSNFKDAGAWFDSLKNAQKEYTQAKQEIASLKTKYAQQDTNPDYKPEDKPPVVPVQESVEDVTQGKLRIPEKKPETTPPTTEPSVSEQDWQTWTIEYATKGTLSNETQETIKQKTGLPDYVIAQYMEGQQAKIEKAYDKASSVIGGKDQLNKLFSWASKNLSQVEQDNMNLSLASPNWEIALLGLEAKYNKMNASKAGNEPPKVSSGNKIPAASTQQSIIGYRTKREFSADRNNPRFEHDPKYRTAVEQRMMRTDFNKLPQ